MSIITITQLKASPSAALSAADDFPVAIQNRNKTAGYLLGKRLFEKMVALLEDSEDNKNLASIDLTEKMDFEEFANKLGI